MKHSWRGVLVAGSLLLGTLVPGALAAPSVVTPLSATTTNVVTVQNKGLVAASWTSRTSTSRPHSLRGNSVLAKVEPVKLSTPIADADATVTVSYTTTVNPVTFEATPVVAGRRVYPFLWARGASSNAVVALGGTPAPASTLSPTETFDAATMIASWAWLPAAPPASGAGRQGALRVVSTKPQRQHAAYGSPLESRRADVSFVTGMIVAEGGATRDAVARFTVPLVGRGSLPHFAATSFSLTPPGGPSARFSLDRKGDTLHVAVATSGTLPSRTSTRRGGEVFERHAIPFLLVLAEGVLGELDAIPGAGLRGWSRQDLTRLELGGPRGVGAEPVAGYGCDFGLGQTNDRSDVTARMSRTGPPAVSDWRIGKAVRREVKAMTLERVVIDGVAAPLHLQDATFVDDRPVATWEDDWVTLLGSDVYDGITSRCAFGDPYRQAATTQVWPGLRAGREQRSVHVLAGVVLETRMSVAPTSRLTYLDAEAKAAAWPVVRIRTRAYSLDGAMHSVVTQVRLDAADASAGTSSNYGDVSLPDGTYPTQDVQFGLRSGDRRDIVVTGGYADATYGRDLVGRWSGADSVLALEGSRWTCASHASASSALPSYFAGSLTAVIAQS